MHVLIPVLHRPTKPTGVCRHAVNLAHCLSEIDHISCITLIIGQWQKAYFQSSFDFSSNKIKIQAIDINNKSIDRNRWYVLGLPKVAKQLNPDIIHLSFPLPFVRRWFSMPVVSTIHDLYPFEYPQNFGYPQVWFNQTFLRQCIRESDGLVCVSKVTSSSLNNYFPSLKKHKQKKQKQIATIYNVVDFSSIKSQVPDGVKWGFSKPFLITVAQHRQNKNLDLLIRAYSTLYHENRLQPNSRLLLIGSQGPQSKELMALVDNLQLKGRVLFLSGVEDTALRWFYEQADLFVIPSSTEGFCLPLVEALSLGCQAVCSDIPIFREVGTSRCHYFKLNDQALPNLIEAIAQALSQPSSATEAADTRFSRHEISQQLLNFYEIFLRRHTYASEEIT